MFVKYQHVEHIDSDNCAGLTNGRCYIFPKLDGMNTSAYMENGKIVCATRNQPVDDDNEFHRYIMGKENIVRLLNDNPNLRLYGEWMKPHLIRNYRDDMWSNWFIFDVCEDDPENMTDWRGRTVRKHLPYLRYSELLDRYGIEYIRPLAVINNPSVEEIQDIADNRNRAYMIEGTGCGEGVVVKNYDYTNPNDETIWGKVLNSAYTKTKRQDRDFGITGIEETIANRVVNPLLVEKEYCKILDAKGEVNPNALLNIVWYCVIKEHLWDEIKRYRNPVIDFGKLRKETVRLVKDAKPEVFEDRDMIEGQES